MHIRIEFTNIASGDEGRTVFPGMCANMRLSHYGGNSPELLVSVVVECVVGLRELG